MVTDVVRVDGDYNIQAKNGAIRLNAQSTIINGGLTVYGTQTNVDTIDLAITATILILNQGEPGPGVTRVTPGFPAYSAGLMVARGNSDSPNSGAFLLYDDSVTSSDGTNTIQGMWRFNGTTAYGPNEYGSAIQVQAIRTPNGATLNLLGADNPNAKLTVKGASTVTTYASRVTDDDDIPNKAYVDQFYARGTTVTQKIQVGKSFIEILDNTVNTNSQYYSPVNQIIATLGTPTNVVFSIADQTAQIQGIAIIGSTIRVANTTSNSNIQISPSGTGNLIVNSGLQILQTPPVSSSTNFTSIYSTSTIGGGGTGVYFVNTVNSDEFVSRKKAIVYSIIF
jgi:hypothetical protein